MKILIIDDDIEFTSQLQKSLSKSYGCIKSKNSLTEARGCIQSESFDILLLDYDLGVGTGFEILETLQTLTEKPKVIFMTSYGTKELAIDSINLGINKFLNKPFRIDSLKKMINELSIKETQDCISFSNKNFSIKYNEESISLTEVEFNIFQFLCENKNQIITNEDLHFHIYKEEVKVKNALQTHLSNLKKKLPSNLVGSLKNIRGKGYIFETA
jgi:DNA-binding response OmpR family regulator